MLAGNILFILSKNQVLQRARPAKTSVSIRADPWRKKRVQRSGSDPVLAVPDARPVILLPATILEVPLLVLNSVAVRVELSALPATVSIVVVEVQLPWATRAQHVLADFIDVVVVT